MILQNKVTLISGVGPGLGRKLALEAAREGARLVLGARSIEFLRRVAQEICQAGGQAIAVPSDVTKREDCARLVTEAIAAFGCVDCLVNVAYRPGPFGLFEHADLRAWRESMDVTLFGPLNMIQSVLPYMKGNGGSIVNIGSISTRAPLENHGPNMVPKAALMSATRQLALELGKYGIRVNNVIFGMLWGVPVENHLVAEATSNGIAIEELIADIAEKIPLKHIPPDEKCAKAILMILSDYASEVTGASLDVNGGAFLPL